MKKGFLFLFMMLIFFSCKKSDFKAPVSESQMGVYEAKTAFSEVLAKAVAKEVLLRQFIKEEALKKFDKDYDILYFIIKDVKLTDGETVNQKMLKYSDNPERFNKWVNDYPLLTIYVPELPNFNAQIWKTDSEVPLIAVSTDTKNKLVVIIDDKGMHQKINYDFVPGFPTLVVKENERVVLETEKLKNDLKLYSPKSDFPEFFTAREGKRFMFLASDFNGSISDISHQTRMISSTDVAPELVTAFTSGVEWHRDYVYYGITPANPNGIYSNDFQECLQSIMFLNPNDYYLVSDDADDPVASAEFYAETPNHPPMWVEGAFEFRMSILINAKNGAGQQLNKIFTAPGSQLFFPHYSLKKYPFLNLWLYKLTSITSSEFRPNNLHIIDWDLEQYGTAWKFILSEYDPSVEITRSITHTTKFGANFGIDIPTGEKVKFGQKFGISGETSESTTYTYKTTEGSEDLGETILDFRHNVIVSGPQPYGSYNTFEITTGILSLSVEPKRMY